MKLDGFQSALQRLYVIAGGLYGVNYEPKSTRDVELATNIIGFINQMQHTYGYKRNDRVVVIKGFNVGAKGNIEFVEPSGEKIWVLRDGASTPVFYRPDELQKIDPIV